MLGNSGENWIGTCAYTAADFCNPNIVKYAESFGTKGYRIKHVGALLPTLKQALLDEAMAVIPILPRYFPVPTIPLASDYSL